MTEQITALTVSEETRLANLETTIETGLKTFYEVGNALAEIRDGRLYRADHATFEDYCRERWNMSRGYAYRMIGAADVVDNLSPIGDIPANESQARPLTKLSPDQQRQAWQRANEAGKPTAAAVQVAADEVTGNYKTAWELQMAIGDWLRNRYGGESEESLAALESLYLLGNRNPRWPELTEGLPKPFRNQDIHAALRHVRDMWVKRWEKQEKAEKQERAETAVTPPSENNRPLEKISTWRLMSYVDEWLGSDSLRMSGWEDDDWGALNAIISKRVGWRVLFDSIKNHIGLANYTEDDLHQAIKNVFNRIDLVRPGVLNGEQTAVPAPKSFSQRLDEIDAIHDAEIAEMLAGDETAVQPGSVQPIATYWLRNYVDPVHNRRWVDLEDNQVHHANSPCFQAFRKQYPDFTDHKTLLKQALANLKRERAAEIAESIKALGDAVRRLSARAGNQELIFKLDLAAQDLDKAYKIAKETAVNEEA